jgi:hypothetical protein
MKKEIQGVLFFLILQNVIFCIIYYLGFESMIGQAVMNVVMGTFLYWYLDHEDRIVEKLKVKEVVKL